MRKDLVSPRHFFFVCPMGVGVFIAYLFDKLALEIKTDDPDIPNLSVYPDEPSEQAKGAVSQCLPQHLGTRVKLGNPPGRAAAEK